MLRTLPRAVLILVPVLLALNAAAIAQDATPVDAEPAAALGMDVREGTPPLDVSFTDRSTNKPVRWEWDFGDGTTSTAQHPKHTFDEAGSYVVRLKVTDAEGKTLETIGTVYVRGSIFGRVARGLLGIAGLLGIGMLLSSNRRRTPWKLIGGAVTMQIVLGLCLIQWDIGVELFEALSRGVTKILSFGEQGATFVFGDIPMGKGSIQIGDVTVPLGPNAPGLFFKSLPTIIFFSCLMAVLYHLRIMHFFIWVLAKIMTRFLGVTGAESMAMAANIFVGQTEAPLVIRRFLPKLTRSELMSLMTGGFATVAGSVLAAYIAFLEGAGGSDLVPHLLIASVMSAPAAFALSKIMVPETEASETGAAMSLEFKPTADNVLDAAATGVTEGLKLFMNVVAMLIAFVAMVALIDWPLIALGERFGFELSLNAIFGWIFAPVAWLMGVEWSDAGRFGSLLGTKIGLNEFLAFLQLQGEVALTNDAALLASDSTPGTPMSHRSLKMATYALCGFANFASIGIQIGGISPIVPERRAEIISLALRAMLGGALASWMTATIAGMFF